MKNTAGPMARSRKSQLYIITALFLSMLVLIATIRPTKLKPPAFDSSQLYENFISESKYTVNSAIYQDKNVSRHYSNFVDQFMTFAGTEGANLKVFYALVYNGRTSIGNRFGGPVNITTGNAAGSVNFILTDRNITTSSRKDWIKAGIDGTDYIFNTSQDRTQLKVIFKTSYENMTEVRTYG